MMMLQVIKQELGECGTDCRVGGSWKVLGGRVPVQVVEAERRGAASQEQRGYLGQFLFPVS